MKLFRLVAVAAFAFALSGPVHAETAASKAANVDLAASQVLWTGKKVVGSHNGSVKLKGAKVEVVGNDVTKAEFEIDLATIKVDDLTDAGSNAKLTGHLKSEDFFSVDKHPTAVFKSTLVKTLPAKAGEPTHEVTGDLTMKGITKPITFPMTVKTEGNKATATAAIAVDRTQWDIRYGSGKFFQSLGDKMIDDTFKIDLKIVASL